MAYLPSKPSSILGLGLHSLFAPDQIKFNYHFLYHWSKTSRGNLLVGEGLCFMRNLTNVADYELNYLEETCI